MEGAASNRVSYQWRVQEGPLPPPPFFLDQTGAEGPNFFSRPGPSYLRVWMTAPPPLTEGLDPPMHIPMIVIAKASLRI